MNVAVTDVVREHTCALDVNSGAITIKSQEAGCALVTNGERLDLYMHVCGCVCMCVCVCRCVCVQMYVGGAFVTRGESLDL